MVHRSLVAAWHCHRPCHVNFVAILACGEGSTPHRMSRIYRMNCDFISLSEAVSIPDIPPFHVRKAQYTVHCQYSAERNQFYDKIAAAAGIRSRDL